MEGKTDKLADTDNCCDRKLTQDNENKATDRQAASTEGADPVALMEGKQLSYTRRHIKSQSGHASIGTSPERTHKVLRTQGTY